MIRYIGWLIISSFPVEKKCCVVLQQWGMFYLCVKNWLIEWNELADYGQEQEMEIEALEAILMDEFKGTFFLSFFLFWFFPRKQTNDMQWQKFILARVA